MSASTARRGPTTLSARHVQFIALGGAIGAGLFVGSSATIARAGPSVLLAYLACGIVIFMIARALGELAIAHPDAGGFSAYAGIYIGEWAGFVTGWTYWLNWVLVVAAELTAVGLLLRFWLPDLPQWLPGLVVLVGVLLLNLTAARVFAEAEFAITLVKVLTIALLIVIGTAHILTHRVSAFGTADVSNLWSGGGWFPAGPVSFVTVLPLVLFAFGGLEVIGVAAAEMVEPAKTVPRAVNSAVARILLFYVGSLAVVMSLVPWSSIRPGSSPFVLAFSALGIRHAADIVNFVVLTAIVSACNTGVFATSRVLRGLALARQAPSVLTTLNSRGVPANALALSACSVLFVVAFNYVTPRRVLDIIMRMDAALLLWIWLTIVWSHLNYRRRNNVDPRKVPCGLPFAPHSNGFVMVFIAFICAFHFVDLPSMGIFALALLWLGALAAIHRGMSTESGTGLDQS